MLIESFRSVRKWQIDLWCKPLLKSAFRIGCGKATLECLDLENVGPLGVQLSGNGKPLTLTVLSNYAERCPLLLSISDSLVGWSRLSLPISHGSRQLDCPMVAIQSTEVRLEGWAWWQQHSFVSFWRWWLSFLVVQLLLVYIWHGKEWDNFCRFFGVG